MVTVSEFNTKPLTSPRWQSYRDSQVSLTIDDPDDDKQEQTEDGQSQDRVAWCS